MLTCPPIPTAVALIGATRMVPAAQLAAIQADVLVRSFVIALVVIAPLWLYRRRRTARERRTSTVDNGDGTTPPSAPRLEDVIAGIDGLAATVDAEGAASLTIPTGVTVDGSEMDAGTVDALVRDALRRSGLVAVAEIDGPAGRTLECRPIGRTRP